MDTRKITKWMLMGLGTGVAAAYLADSEFGKERRAALARGTRKVLDKAARKGKKSLCDSQHRLAGLAARVRAGLQSETPSDSVLEARIRSRLGRVISHPRKVHVTCDHGAAIVWGIVPSDKIAGLIREIEMTSGVVEVVDHLEADLEEPAKEPSNPLKRAKDEAKLDWSPAKRLLSGTTGAALAAYGWRRHDLLGKALSVLGAGLVVRGAMQNHLRASLALGASSPGFELEKTIRINAPISDLFDFWADPKNYPKAFPHVAEVEQLGENLYRWTIHGPGGMPMGWEGMLTRTIPNTLVEWKSLPGSPIGNFGRVHFDAHYDASTRIHIRMFYRPPAGIAGKIFAELFGADPGKILDHDLKRLKNIFENANFPAERKKEELEEAELLKTATT